MSLDRSFRRNIMCEANAYILKNGNEELYLENVDILRPEDGKIFLRNLFGEQKVFEGEVKEISLIKHKIVLESSD
jgi:predicted RNA-binding protein